MSDEKTNESKGQDGHDGDDVLTGTAKNDKIAGKDGNDEIYGLAGNDKLKGDNGNDFLYGGEGNDDLDGGHGNDFIEGSDGNDKLKGDDGDDILLGGAGNDNLDGGTGNDVLEGGRGKDNISGDDGDDEIIWSAGDGEDQIRGGKGNDTFTLNTSDTVQQVVRLDTNNKGDLVVSLDGGDQGGTLTLREIENFQLHIGEAGASIQLGDIDDDALGDQPLDLGGGAGSDTIDASNSNQAVSIDAGTGDDTVSGGSAADTISGGEGSDIITGGGGDDIIDAGVGDDLVLWEAGDGNDTIDGGDGFDELDLTLSATEPSTLSISADVDGNVILVSDDGTVLTVDGVEDIVINAGVAGTSITIGDLTGTDIAQDTLYFVGGAGDDFLDASATDRRINASGGDGNDTLLSGSGNDTLDGGAGDDVLDAGSGQGVDTILGGSGNDIITATLGDEQGSNATDIVDGGADEDTLNVIFVEPTPHDLILRVSSNGDGSFNVTSEDIDVDEILHASNIENLKITAAEGALNFVLDSLADTSLTSGVEFEGSADADSFNASQTDIATTQFGLGGDDSLTGGFANDLLFGGSDNDTLIGGDGDDNLTGGTGDDILDGGQGHDRAFYTDATAAVNVDLNLFSPQDTGSSGMDTLVNIEEVQGSAFNDTISGNDQDNNLFGGAGDDTLSGGGGFDIVHGGDGNDNLHDADSGVLHGDAGDDFIDGMAAYHADPSRVIVNYGSSDLDVHGDGSLILGAESALDGHGGTDSFGALARNLEGSAYDDILSLDEQNSFIFGRAGDDRIDGLGGDDWIEGGSGNDVIDGGDGADYVFYTNDDIDHLGAPTQGVNVNLAAGTATDGFGHSDTLANIENVRGSSLADTIVGDINDNTILGREGDDVVDGGGGNDSLFGWSGNDDISGGDGDDQITGDVGDDTLSGGSGADTYQFITFADGGSNLFGHDSISDFDVAEDILDLSPFGVTNISDFLTIAADDGSDTTITIDVNSTITLSGVTAAQFSAANFIFSEPEDPGQVGTDENDELFGAPGDDNISGLAGNDILVGFAGNDVLDGGDDFDTANYTDAPAGVSVNLTTGVANDGYGDIDTLINIEAVWGSIFSDTLIGNAEDNYLAGESSAGAGAADILQAGAGNDGLNGGPGIDSIDGGAGQDVLYFTREGVSFNTPGIEITFQADGSIVSYNPNNGETESDILNIEAVAGTIGHDIITGNAGDNFIQGFGGDDVIDGGAGNDTVFNTLWLPVTVDLEAGTVTRPAQPWAGTQILTSIENAIGSPGDDVLIGDSGNNILEGLGGDDQLRGGAGDDFLNGGASTLMHQIGTIDVDSDGFDVADYSADPAGVTVNLNLGTASDGYGNTDSLNSIEGVIGSDFNDTLIGNDGGNAFEAGAGDDSISGGAGADNFVLSDDGNNNADFGLDTISDFNSAEDTIDVTQFSNFQSYSELDISQDGSDTLITFDAGNILRLSNVSSGSLNDSHFNFALSLNLVGTEGNDTLQGEEGDDQINGLGGDDQLFGGGGDDFIVDGDGSDNVNGEDGNDTLSGSNDNFYDNFFGGAGDDIITTGTGGSSVQGGPGNDTVTGTSGDWNDIQGNEGDDVLITPENSGFVDGGAGNDTLDGLLQYERDPNGVIVNLDNAQWDVHGDGSVLVDDRTALDGYGGTDTLGAGAISLHASYFDDYVRGSDFGQYFILRAGDDTAFGLDGDDSFDGGSGDDYLDGGDGFDNVQYQNAMYDGSDITTFQGIVANISTTDFNHGTGIAFANRVEDNFGGTDSVFNMDSVDGSNMDDIIVGSDQHNWLRGNEGNDQLFGKGESDNLVGGPGDDVLDGGDGDNDTAWYKNGQELGGINVNLATGIVSDDGFGNTDTLISIEGIEGSEHADTIIGNEVRNVLIGNDGDDLIQGGAGDDHIEGRNGNDQAFGDEGNDWLSASDGDDLLDGGADSDTVDYQSYVGTTSGISVDLSVLVNAGGHSNVAVASDGFGGTDYLRNIERIHATDFNDSITGDGNQNDFFGGAGNDVLNGGGGNDYLSGEDDFDTLNGGVGNDHLDGGENDDNLTGGSEGDTFSFTRFTQQGDLTSFGEDTITDFSVAEDHLDLWQVPEFSNLATLLSYAVQDGSDVLISFVSNDFGVDETNSIRLQNLTIADLSNMSISFSPIAGTENDDVLNGTVFDDNIQGFGGNDVLNGNDGNDDLDGGTGNDNLNGGTGYDNLRGGPGDDVLDGGTDQDNANYRWSGEINGVTVDLSTGITSNDGFGNTDTLVSIENVEGSEFADSIAGDAQDNHLEGREGDDVIHGAGGNDSVRGSEGADQLFGETGADWFDGGPGDDLIDGGADEDRVNYDGWTGTNGPVTIDLSTIVASAGGYANVVVVADDGHGNTDYLRDIEHISGSDFSDNLTGDAQRNELIGHNGDDVLIGNEGDDHLQGDAGNDSLIGGAGNDFLIGGDGADTIDGGADWDNLAYDSWTGVVNGVNVDLGANTVSNDGFGNIDSVFNIERVQGSDFDDVIAGDGFDNHLVGGGGNDTLSSGGGNDSFEGGSGDDLFILSDGDSIWIGDFVAGAGSDDVIDLQAVTSLTDFAGVLSAAVDDGAGNVNIDIGGNNIHLVGVSTGNLHADDFAF